MKRVTTIILPFIIISLLFSCQKGKVKNIPDVSHIDIDLNIKRFEKDLFTIDTTQIVTESAKLMEKYPVFMPQIFLKEFFPSLEDPQILKRFVQSPQLQQLYDTCTIVYGNFSDLEAEFTDAFRFYKHHFPDNEIPEIITYISEYSVGAFTYEGILGVGIDFFLGANYPHYNVQFFPNYIKRSMDKAHLTAKAMEAVANDLVGNPNGNRLIDLMIHNGKIHYIIDQLLPHHDDQVKMAFTKKQMQWVKENELQLWAHFVKEDLLYSTKYKDIRKLVEHSPNAPGMPPEAPGRTANWVGFQIINTYMERFPETTIPELLAITDAQQILDRSKYKPGR